MSNQYAAMQFGFKLLAVAWSVKPVHVCQGLVKRVLPDAFVS